MTRILLISLTIGSLLLAGCSGDSGQAPVTENANALGCLDHQSRQAFNQTQTHGLWDLLGPRFTMVLEGDIGDEVGRFAISVDDQNQTLLVRKETDEENQELRYNQEFYNVINDRGTNDEETFVGRDYHPLGASRMLAEDFRQDEQDFWDAVDDLSIEEYEISCVKRNAADAVLFYHQSSAGEEQLVLQARAPHRPISGFFVDPFLGEQGRVSFTYDPFSVDIDMTTNRVAAQLALDVVSEPANQHYMNISAEVLDDSARIPFSELEFHIWDEDTRKAEKMFQMGHGTWEMGTVGWFVFYDNDRDEHLSKGDSYVASLRDDHVVRFYDLWAERYATIE